MLSLVFRYRGSVNWCQMQTNNQRRYPKTCGRYAHTLTWYIDIPEEASRIPADKIHSSIHDKELHFSNAIIPHFLQPLHTTATSAIRAYPHPICDSHLIIQLTQQRKNAYGRNQALHNHPRPSYRFQKFHPFISPHAWYQENRRKEIFPPQKATNHPHPTPHHP